MPLNPEQIRQSLQASCLPLAYLTEPERRARKPTGMENYSESTCFHRYRDLLWPISEPAMEPYLTREQSVALAAFEQVYHSLQWRIIEGHPHISELPDDDLSPLVPFGEHLLRLIKPQESKSDPTS